MLGLRLKEGKLSRQNTEYSLGGRLIIRWNLDLKTFDLGKGELDLNKDIFGMTKERYQKYGEPADKLGVRSLSYENTSPWR